MVALAEIRVPIFCHGRQPLNDRRPLPLRKKPLQIQGAKKYLSQPEPEASRRRKKEYCTNSSQHRKVKEATAQKSSAKHEKTSKKH
ncbi:hypothetical protein ANCDUO_08593 [Ancylostoma duodenale]|uniref:Uncharacterized protein n=1 Tax=Ancylostoma duodenale TaxID=51022 RepID=A0A0C2DFA4_9BILA|nr:hypothetical protein ANCDUO_08593 [Ancylostoma duodenale]